MHGKVCVPQGGNVVQGVMLASSGDMVGSKSGWLKRFLQRERERERERERCVGATNTPGMSAKNLLKWFCEIGVKDPPL